MVVNDEWLNSYSMSMANFMARGLSDHNPSAVNMGIVQEKIRKPFQFFHYMLSDPRFNDIVKEAWSSQVSGNPWYILTSKLKIVKARLRRLNANNGNLHAAVVEARNKLINFQNSLPPPTF